jgi:hypothetical protein
MNALTRLLRLWPVPALVAWAGLIGLVNARAPSPPALAAAALLLLLAITTTTAPLWLRLQRRLYPDRALPHQISVAWLRGLETGLVIVILLMLRIAGLLDGISAAIVLATMVLVDRVFCARLNG